ncbi:MAG: sulfotransferase family 2 domain-containing protein [Xanthomonadales bacterium]|jgi:hypothetical protein|nr:sulfotransferase family 2 domain-containing protein [Xanthomonadales bacterium]
MTRSPLAEKMLYRLLRIRPSPLRFGNETPFIFLHINKTAGTSIGKAVGLHVKQHLTAREIIERIGREKWVSAWKFTFVRNPWDRAVSLYEYRRGKDRTGIATRDLSFSAWTQRVFCEDPDPAFHNNPKSFQTQSEWLRDDRGEIDIDFVGRFENIAGDFAKIANKIAPGASLRHLNASARAAYGSYYDSGSKERVTRWFKEDIERFGYVFEP